MAGDPAKHPPSGSSHPRAVLIAGPTAAGKSAVALQLAERLGGEIVSVDSMQVYRGLDIGTAKPAPHEQARVPHHLIGIAELSESFDAAKFVALARQAVGAIQSRGRVPILCGGTGLYFKAFLDGLGETPPADASLRAVLEATPLPTLLAELQERDPETFARIDRKNPRRIVRAVEVLRLTGRPFSAQRAAWNDASSVSHRAESFFGITRGAGELRARIDARVDEMFRRGLVEETRQLLARGLEQNRTALQAIGYRQVIEHLRGERSLEATVELVKIRTRQFARRQFTWFRKYTALEWLEISSVFPVEAAVAQIATRLKT